MDFTTFFDETGAIIAQKLRNLGRPGLAELYEHCYRSTIDTTVRQMDDGTIFLVTGDIPAMWLRDSSAQVRHYLRWAACNNTAAQLIEKLLQRQFAYIGIDAYANAFNPAPNAACYEKDQTNIEHSPWVWERKYEIDSLCYPFHLTYDFWKETGKTTWNNDTFQIAVHKTLDVWRTEQHHAEQSAYYFKRANCPSTDTLPENGRGNPVAYTGMTWSGFRPSDDACVYGYLIPANFFAATVLDELAILAEKVMHNPDIASRASQLAMDIRQGIKKHGIVKHEIYGDVYAYETDGRGNHILMDDANVPSLLSLPYLGCCPATDTVYQNTRRFILSPHNPYYYSGSALQGVGSPHTPPNYVWSISLSIQGLTAIDKAERAYIINMLEHSHAGTLQMHEGIDMNNPTQYTRPWFAWANSLFCELVDRYVAEQ